MYKINSVAMDTPTGSIMSYLGTTDPTGWVICDGVLRTNTDGRFNILITNSFGSGTLNVNYTPINLSGKMLYGKNTGDTINSNIGGNTVTLTTQNLPSHNHTIPSHDHGVTYNNWPGKDQYVSLNGSRNEMSVLQYSNGGQGQPSVTIHGSGVLTSHDTGSATPVNVPTPPSYVVNFIMKC